MLEVYSVKKRCVLCHSANLVTLIEFPMTPIANEITGACNENIEFEKFPLILGMCLECKHIQLLSMIDPVRLFSQYTYQSNSNKTTEARLDSLAYKLDETYGVKNSKKVLEIGSNDGHLLEAFSKRGWKILGVDPAENIAAIANARGIETINDFFGSSLLPVIEEKISTPDLIVANNVLAHSDELVDIFEGISSLMGTETVLILEFSYLGDVFEKLLFDTIYHEHTSYHSILSLSSFLKRYELELFDLERISAHGGSLRVHICKSSTRLISPEINLLLQREKENKLDEIKTWSNFAERIDTLKVKVHEEINELTKANGKLVGYGVPAKFATLFHVLELDSSKFDYLVDDNEIKIGGFGPGTSLSIKSFFEFEKSGGTDNLFLFSWNYAEEIVEKLISRKLVRSKIIIPLPIFQVKQVTYQI
jgi:hypothetical protein